ncbi:Neugrin [Popillia japonica]|uniref:Neugrin n=1 Tax=Popillia japonica TaxID=7064 RepID=A0AAW1MFB2_POPJA
MAPNTLLIPALEDKVRGSEDIGDIMDLDSLESDFMQAGNVYNEHAEQVAKLKEQEKILIEQEKILIVKQKYFKEKYPNFLTWNDKEQIRYLHKTNPDEWTIEKLSDGFPALPETIKKIIKASWTKTSSTKIMNHDNSVKRNWEMFKKDQLDLPVVLTNHLQKFTSRNYNQCINNIVLPSIEIKPKVQGVHGEFSEIIKSYERLKTKHTGEEERSETGEFSEIIKSYERLKTKHTGEEERSETKQEVNTKKPAKEMYLISNVTQNNHTTLDSLKTSLRTNASLGEEITEDDKILLRPTDDTSIITNEIPKNSIIDLKDVSKTTYLSTSSNMIPL